MKRIAAIFLVCSLLAGCAGKRDELDRAMALRAVLLGCESCSFDAAVTADYGDSVQTFGMSCQGDSQGKLTFAVTQPASIAGITGVISAGEGALTFDGMLLEFPMLADGQVTPVSAPWILLKTLLGGYLTACTREEELLHLTVNDSYADDALEMEIWLDAENRPVQGEILFDGRRIVAMTVENFQIQ